MLHRNVQHYYKIARKPWRGNWPFSSEVTLYPWVTCSLNSGIKSQASERLIIWAGEGILFRIGWWSFLSLPNTRFQVQLHFSGREIGMASVKQYTTFDSKTGLLALPSRQGTLGKPFHLSGSCILISKMKVGGQASSEVPCCSSILWFNMDIEK